MSIAWLRRRQSTHSASKGFDCVAFPNPSPPRGSTASPGTRESTAATDDPMDVNFLTDLPISLSPRSSLSTRPQRTADAHTKSVLPPLQDVKLRKKDGNSVLQDER
eukprot:symbB.v1.2.018869.t1/scaffold1520.1/size114066/15